MVLLAVFGVCALKLRIVISSNQPNLLETSRISATVAIRRQRLSCYNLVNDSNIFGDETIEWKGLVIISVICA